MKIVSLLPSATEIVFALGLGDQLCGVSFECDHPAAARTKPIVSTTALPLDRPLDAAEIDREVSSRVAAGTPIYTLDAERIRSIRPDVILAQDLCAVCAVPTGAVDEALATIGCRADVVSLDPASLDDVIRCVGQVGEATGTTARADRLMGELRDRVERVRQAVAGRPRPRALALEWSDPPFSGGHWVPDMIDAAGGRALLAAPGDRSIRLAWADIERADAEVVLFMPCGYDLDAAATEGRALTSRPELASAPRVWALPGNDCFSRPGPRVVDGVELLGSLLHPDLVATPDTTRAVALR